MRNMYGRPCCNSHFISISVYKVLEVRTGIQVSKRELYTHIRLDYVRIKIISYKKNNKKEKKGLQDG